jgi:peptide/nickel transport system permease protein
MGISATAIYVRGLSRSVARLRRAAWPTGGYFIAGIVLSALIVTLTAIGPNLAPASPYSQDLSAVLQAPGPIHRFGTDALGRDVLSRVLYGGRLTLEAGVAIVLSSFLVGLILGAIGGFFGGVLDEAIMRSADLILSFPWLVLAMAVAAALGPSISHGVLSLVIVWWPVYARVARGEVLRVKRLEYVESSLAAGADPVRILWRTILPNIIGVPMSMTPLDFGRALGAFAGLSFLGLVARPPAAELGAMLNEARTMPLQWWIAFFPGAALAVCILASNLLGIAVRRRGPLGALR